MYVATKGGEKAIAAAHEELAVRRRGDKSIASLSVRQIREQLRLAVDRVMAEGSLFDRDIAALAIKQARGDLIEAIFLVRAYRATLPRFGYTQPIETDGMRVSRRISAAFKDVPGGQILGPTFDYSHRILDFSLMDDDSAAAEQLGPREVIDDKDVADDAAEKTARVYDVLAQEGLIEADSDDGPAKPADITREPVLYPADRDARLQQLARGDEGYVLALGYSTQRGYARSHPFAGEIRFGEVDVIFDAEDIGLSIVVGSIDVTECDMVNQFKGSAETPPAFTRGYGLVFGQSERKAMSMALVDRALRADEFDEEVTAPAQDQEFVLAHSDNVQASGFVEHLKLPHHVDFQAELELVRRLRAEALADTDHDANAGEAAE